LVFLGLVFVFFLIAFVGSAVWRVVTGIQNKPPGPVSVPRPGEPINVLCLGVDKETDETGHAIDVPLRKSRARTDTMILVSFDPTSNSTSVIFIPRDSRTNIPNRGWDKVNAAHAYGGPLLAMHTVEDMLDLPVHYYVRTNFEGVKAIVDVLGGIEIDVLTDMRYDDPYQDLRIDLTKGRQVLDGDHAVQFLRYRSDGGDIARIQRQQDFIGAFVRKVLSFSTVFRAQALAREVVKYIDTNMSSGEMFDFAVLASRIGDPQIQMGTLPGEVRVMTDPGRGPLSYWVLDEAGTTELVGRLVYGIDTQKNATVRVRVLNATTVRGLAGEMAAKLRADGFNVVEVGNAEANGQDKTRVVDHTGQKGSGELVMRSVMRYAADATLYSEVLQDRPCEVTVFVGSDFKPGE
jgi:LCP family protein required for cell wall assembly